MGEVAVISASLGGFDKKQQYVEQSVEYDRHHFTDKNFPPRFNSMTPRLQARIPKMFGWQMKPDYEYYLWVDSSCRLSDKDSIQWFIDQLGDNDIAVFKHPHRATVQEEADYLRHRLAIRCPYITPRYGNERLDDQMAAVDGSAQLYATTAFIYRNNLNMRDLLTVWWLHTSLYHSIDQLSLPTAITHSQAKVTVIPDNYLKIKQLQYVRNK